MVSPVVDLEQSLLTLAGVLPPHPLHGALYANFDLNLGFANSVPRLHARGCKVEAPARVSQHCSELC